MRITFDPRKRDWTLEWRQLDFADAPKVFAGKVFQMVDDRQDYGETRWITVGLLDRSMTIVVWTWRDDARRIISMRKCNAKERRKYRPRLD